MNEPIGIVTVLYNSETVLKDFFISLDSQTYASITLYVIDNKSPDNSLALARELSKTVRFNTVFIANEDNYGVAKGNNQGIQKAIADGFDYILLSNNDVVLDPFCIERLYQGLIAQQADMAVPKIFYFNSPFLWAAGGYFNKWNGLNFHYGDHKNDAPVFSTSKEVTYAATCFMLINKRVFEKTGLMDEAYFVYWDDVDFVYRARKQGLILWYIPESVLWHKESTSTGVMSDFSIRFSFRNMVYFAMKNYWRPYAIYVLLVNILYSIFVLPFKWPLDKWRIKMSAYSEGWNLYQNSK
jgi:GT2 family glycosyltransferase